MNCCPDIILLEAYHDGELSPEQRAEIDHHLAGGCDACAAEMRRLEALSRALATWGDARLTAEARQRIYALAPDASQGGYFRLTQWVAGIAAAVLIAGGAWRVLRNQTASPVRLESGTTSWVSYAINPAESAQSPDQPIAAWLSHDPSTGDQP